MLVLDGSKDIYHRISLISSLKNTQNILDIYINTWEDIKTGESLGGRERETTWERSAECRGAPSSSSIDLPLF